jgi:hypothetical protein
MVSNSPYTKIDDLTYHKSQLRRMKKLTAIFTLKEVEAIFQMKHNKAHGSNGFPAEFYQIFLETIKGDLIALFKDFHD